MLVELYGNLPRVTFFVWAFPQDDEGKSGPFITSVLKLMKAGREKYMKEIVEYLENHR